MAADARWSEWMASAEPNSQYGGLSAHHGRHRLTRLDALAECAGRQWADDEPRLFCEIVRHIPGGITLARASDGLLLYTNPAFLHMLGLAPGELPSQHFDLSRHLASSERKAVAATIRARLAAGEQWAGDIRLLRKDGSSFCSHCTVIGFEHHEHGRLWLSIHEDVTERRRAEQELRLAHDLLQVQMDELRDLHAQLRDMAIRDPLTQLYNRRYLHETLPRETARADREAYALAVLMIDIDHFKLLNDTFGHAAGDAALCAVAGLVMGGLRASDIACRYGGEEILCLLLDADAAIAMRRAEELRAAIAAAVVKAQPAARITASIGVAIRAAGCGDIGDVIAAADQALYEAKAAGRNCVRLSAESEASWWIG